MNLAQPSSTGSASELSVRVRFSASGPTVLHGDFPKSVEFTGIRRGAFSNTLMKERIWINRVCEIVFQPLLPDTGAPLHEERVMAVYILNSSSVMSQMECGHL